MGKLQHKDASAARRNDNGLSLTENAFVASNPLRQREASILAFIQTVLKCMRDNSNCVIDVGVRGLNEKRMFLFTGERCQDSV
jgi:hypothetical protein